MEISRSNLIKTQKGFTYIELSISIGILIFLVLISFPIYSGMRDNMALDNSVHSIVSTMQTAQSHSMASFDGVSHGVKFNSDDYILYAGSVSAPLSSKTYSLNSGISIGSGAGTNVEFTRLTGKTTTASIVVNTTSGESKTISINSAGMISTN